MKKHNNWFLLFICLCCIGCASYPTNSKLDHFDKSSGYRFQNLSSSDNTDSLFVILAFSGGGTRAAAFSYGVLEKLRDTTINWKGKSRRLLDEVDVISAVSGGSFTAAYYALYHDDIFKDYESRFLKKNIKRELKLLLFSPINWLRLASPTFDRIDLATEYYDNHIFDHHTFIDLVSKGRRPYILINATDMSQGSRFEFTQDQFDLICSDLSALPIARSVAASSAFPVLLSPITLKNFAGGCSYQEPEWLENALLDRDVAARRFNEAVLQRSYMDSNDRPYVHLIDGGIADNIGLRGPLHALLSLDGGLSILRMINMQKVEKVLIIIVNARTNPDTTMDKCSISPGLKDVLMNVASVPMDNYSFDTIELFVQSSKQWEKDYQARKDCEHQLETKCPGAELPGGQLVKVDFYPIVIGFESLDDVNEREFFKNLPTSFNLPPETIDRIRGIAHRLISASNGYQKLLRDLNSVP